MTDRVHSFFIIEDRTVIEAGYAPIDPRTILQYTEGAASLQSACTPAFFHQFPGKQIFVSLKKSGFPENGKNRFFAGGFGRFTLNILPRRARYQLGSPCRVHPDNKENYGKQDKPELSDIKVHTVKDGEEERVYYRDDRIEE